MTLNQLRALLLAASTGSFTAAAAELRVSQASVSELIRRMEDEIGLPLFARGGRRLVLTSAGTELLPYAEQSVSAADNGSEAVRSLRSLSGGVATFGLLRNADYYLSGLIEQFMERYPKVRVRLVGLNSVEVAAAVAAGELEAGMVVLPIDDEGLAVKPLMRDDVLYASSDPGMTSAPMTVERMSTARLVLYDAHYAWKDPTRRQIFERASVAGVKLEPWVEVEHVETALRLVARGTGDTIICRAIAESANFPAGVHSVPFEDRMYDTIAFIKRENAVLSPATREFAALAQRMLLARLKSGIPEG